MNSKENYIVTLCLSFHLMFFQTIYRLLIQLLCQTLENYDSFTHGFDKIFVCIKMIKIISKLEVGVFDQTNSSTWGARKI